MIYCVEDDGSIRELVVYTLQNTGFPACGLGDGAALAAALPSLLLLDIMLPGEDGISILRRLRQSVRTQRLPVILLTAKDAEYDKVLGLDSGADDYICKPFGMMELVSRVRAVLRRTGEGETREAYAYGGITLSVPAHRVAVDGRPVELTRKEFELLALLLQNEGRVLTRDRLLDQVWGYRFDGETRTVDVHIRTLRQKLGDCGGVIETVRGVGYRVGDGA